MMNYDQYQWLKSEFMEKAPMASIGLVAGALSPWSRFLNRPQNRTEYYTQSILGALFPPLGKYYTARDSMAYMDDYMRNRGLSWRDVKYPTRTVGWSVGNDAIGALNYVSGNLHRLYR